jgi:hypothetical protein
VNAQVGDSLVTNPEGGAVPDEFLISRIGPQGEYETQYIHRSNRVEEGRHVLTRAQTQELIQAMETIQAHFAKLHQREGDATFAMDIEFKIDRNGKLLILQARPVVD